MSITKFSTLLIFIVLLAGCKTDPELINQESERKSTPSTFTKKVVVEVFNGTWCGYSPDGDLRLYEIIDIYGDRAEFIEYHLGGSSSINADEMDIESDDAIGSAFWNGYIPTAMIDRINGESGNRGGWMNLVKNSLNFRSTCGLSIHTSIENDGELNVNVGLAIGKSALEDGQYYLTVVLYEREMSGKGMGWNQINYFSRFGGAAGGSSHPFYNQPIEIENYPHPNVVREVLSSSTTLGDQIPLDNLEERTESHYTYTTNVSAYGEDLKVIAFIHQYNSDPSNFSSYVLNSQWCDVGKIQPFD